MSSKQNWKFLVNMDNIKNNQLITKSNYLIEASYRLTLQEQRLILFMASMVRSDDEELRVYRINIRDFNQIIGVRNESAYTETKELTKKLLERVLIIKDPTIKRELQIGWVSSADYYENQGYIELEFSPKLRPYLLELKSRFTQYQLKNIIKLKSSYSIRLYELLKQYEKIGERYFDLDKLRGTLGIDIKEYPLYANFKQKVLKKAEIEIAEKTDIIFTFNEFKDKKKVTGIHFIIKPNSEKQFKESRLDEIINNQLNNDNEIFEYIDINKYQKYIEVICDILKIENEIAKKVFKLFYEDIFKNLLVLQNNKSLKTSEINYFNKTMDKTLLKDKNYKALNVYLMEINKQKQYQLKIEDNINKEKEEELKNTFEIELKQIFRDKYNLLSEDQKEIFENEYIEHLKEKNKFQLKNYNKPGIENNFFSFYMFLKEKVLNKDDLVFDKWKEKRV